MSSCCAVQRLLTLLVRLTLLPVMQRDLCSKVIRIFLL